MCYQKYAAISLTFVKKSRLFLAMYRGVDNEAAGAAAAAPIIWIVVVIQK